MSFGQTLPTTIAAPHTCHKMEQHNKQQIPLLARLIFSSRWLQLPLYLGLIVAQIVYVYHFLIELWHLVGGTASHQLDETGIMLIVLALIDVVMISNLLIMVTVGGYETFVSRMRLETHPDQPEWLDHVNASVLKVKLAMAIIGISSIHLLKTFINAEQYETKTIVAQASIHVIFLFSAVAIAWCDRLISQPANGKAH
ncbi:uncharacterized protein (TIGR00645 family) [Limnobacter thiooxidans]|nr:uncharacterized protein (TIGR00645 family) [Limnobacter thiooxidans]